VTSPGGTRGEPGAPLATLAVLGERTRWRLYAYARAARRPVTREEAAASAGISRKLAAFHLDKLVAAGLLQASYSAPPGPRRVGRTPKTYRPADTGVEVSIPARRHDLLAGILLDAVLAAGTGTGARSAALAAAQAAGHALGAGERERRRPGQLGAERALTIAGQLLAEDGFEPDRAAPADLRLRNCPFQPLAGRNPELVCAISHAYVAGLLAGLGATTAAAVPDPQPGFCCVRLARAG
jgi:predicted ArsR family transcriptional regulator